MDIHATDASWPVLIHFLVSSTCRGGKGGIDIRRFRKVKKMKIGLEGTAWIQLAQILAEGKTLLV